MGSNPSPVDGLACALRALEGVDERRRIARLAAVRYVFEALSEGVPVGELIARTGFVPPASARSRHWVGINWVDTSSGSGSCPDRAFVDWMVDQFRELLEGMAGC